MCIVWQTFLCFLNKIACHVTTLAECANCKPYQEPLYRLSYDLCYWSPVPVTTTTPPPTPPPPTICYYCGIRTLWRKAQTSPQPMLHLSGITMVTRLWNMSPAARLLIHTHICAIEMRHRAGGALVLGRACRFVACAETAVETVNVTLAQR